MTAISDFALAGLLILQGQLAGGALQNVLQKPIDRTLESSKNIDALEICIADAMTTRTFPYPSAYNGENKVRILVAPQVTAVLEPTPNGTLIHLRFLRNNEDRFSSAMNSCL